MSLSEEVSALKIEIYKLKQEIESLKNPKEIIVNSLSVDEKIDILEKEIVKHKNDIAVSSIVYNSHECDSYEDLFRDNVPRIKEICDGINVAIKNLKR